jgi:hypothetical protein
MNPLSTEYRQEDTTLKFDTKHAIKLQEFEWSLVQCYHTESKQTLPTWTRAYNRTGFANAEKRLFGKGNYEFYIRIFQGLLGFHKIDNTKNQVCCPTTTPTSTFYMVISHIKIKCHS